MNLKDENNFVDLQNITSIFSHGILNYLILYPIVKSSTLYFIIIQSYLTNYIILCNFLTIRQSYYLLCVVL